MCMWCGVLRLVRLLRCFWARVCGGAARGGWLEADSVSVCECVVRPLLLCLRPRPSCVDLWRLEYLSLRAAAAASSVACAVRPASFVHVRQPSARQPFSLVVGSSRVSFVALVLDASTLHLTLATTTTTLVGALVDVSH